MHVDLEVNVSQLAGPVSALPVMQNHSGGNGGFHDNQRAPQAQQVSQLNTTMTTVGSGPYPDDETRGRERDRQSDMAQGGDNSRMGAGSMESPTTRKRRRSRKGLERKFECPHPGCGKFYSRAEHLYRHQLNHQPKQIYFCDFPDCKRSFVRQDLCTRHRERHTNNRGSHLQRNINNPTLPVVNPLPPPDRRDSHGPRQDSSTPESPDVVKKEDIGGPGSNGAASVLLRRASTSTSPEKRPASEILAKDAKFQRTGGDPAQPQRRASIAVPEGAFKQDGDAQGGRFGSGGNPNIQPLTIATKSNNTFNRPIATTPTQNMHNMTLQSPYPPTPSTSAPPPFKANPTTSAGNTGVHVTAASSGHYSNQQAYQNFQLPQPAYPNLTHSTGPGSGHNYITSGPTSSSADAAIIAVTSAAMDIDPMTMQYSMPVFGDVNYSRSPQWGHLSGDWLDLLMGGADPHMLGQANQEGNPFYQQNSGPPSQDMYAMAAPDQFPTAFFNQPLSTHPMNISTIAPPSPPRESLLSEEKRSQLLYVVDQFNDVANLFPSGIEKDGNALSLNMMQMYISLYWVHFHPQLPILHRPTFSAEKTPDILLLCIIVIGMACMDFKQDPNLAQEAVDLANVITKSLRWAIFAEDDFRPPAKLWVFQALLLLETYEKMYADRRLHERAHIHHATTLTLMRRGSSLTGRWANDSPQSGRDANSDGSSVTFSGQPGAGTQNSNDEGWNRWIVQEATKRVAFAAFVLDSTHATMFGHSAVMVAHEMRLQLPCDETLWAATSASEVYSIQQSLYQNNVHTPTFLEGLKKTLQGVSVPTNSFGRTILMAGLLSVGWHLHQRDLQISSLGNVAQQLGGRDRWRHTLTLSFDHWKKDFDTSLSKLRSRNFDGITYYATEDVEHENIFESRTVLHHLAHMSMHVDIVDLQIYAGARRLLGRSITRHDAETVRKRMKQWAPSARARDAAFYAFRFLSQVLLPEERADMQYDDEEGSATTLAPRPQSTANSTTGVPVYSARDDHLLNRPWVLYYACLVVWSYGYALEGPLEKPIVMPSSPAQSYAAMRKFLSTAGNLKSPEELGPLLGKNDCLGLLMTLKGMFANCRWELLLEASKLLNNCVNITTGDIPN